MFFLGVEVIRLASGLCLSQRQYIMDLLRRTNMTSAKSAPTPMSTTPTLTLHYGKSLKDTLEYRSTVGALQ